ncbi:MAG: hypothetical protein HDT20_09615 [Oscillibacter sp.]|nr:hypothetical protein [Oscillibacter sp.]
MSKIRNRAVVLLLALSMLLSLAACGKDKDNAQQLSATVYVPQYIDLDLDMLGNNYDLDGGCTDGTNIYLLVDIYPDWEAGEEGDTRYAIIRVPLDGSEPSELENFHPGEPPEGYDEASSYLNNIRMGADGSLWVEETVYATSYDLPEDFNAETDYMWNYEVLENVNLEYQVQLDSTGTEITRVETSGLAEKLEAEWLYSDGTAFDKDGDMYVSMDRRIAVLDASLNVRFTVEDDSLWGGSLVLLSDGTVGAVVSVSDTINQTYTRQLRSIDKDAKDWGASYDLPENAYETYSGGGDYLFYYKNGETLYGYKAEVEEGAEPGERLLSWLDADINSDDIQFFSFLPDGRVVVMTRSWGSSGGPDITLAILTATDRSELPEKVTLTYATMSLGQQERNRIIEFNKTSTTHRIEVTDYSEYATSEDYFAGRTRLNTEILTGNTPDIISVYGLPLRQYGAKGILEDLWPFIEKDPDLGREKLMEKVLVAAEQDGKLYQIFDSFSINTIIGSSKVVGESMGWTMAEFQEALSSMPEGCTAFGEGYTKSDMLGTLLYQNLDSYVDWNTGECFFDSDSFKTALAFCNTFPTEFDWENYEYSEENSDTARIASGRQMLNNTNISDFRSMQLYEAQFGGEEALQRFYLNYDYSPEGHTVEVSDVPVVDQWGGTNESVRVIPGRYITFKGYPMEDGSCGSSFSISNGVAISSTCKDKEAAWSFIRQLLLPDDENNNYWRWNFPVNKADFEKMAAESMEKEYMTNGDGSPVLDLDGNPIEESKGGWGTSGLNIDTRAVSQEEYDQIMELYNAITNISAYDTSISDIVNDVAGSYFAGDKSLDDAADLIQNRVKTYVNENR